jgi:enoyl-CoA hydratase/carnithine racemase
MSLVRVEGDSVVTVTLDRPESRNALSVELCLELTETFADLEQRTDVRVVVLKGEGAVFCSGADFAAVSGPGGLQFLPAFEEMLERIATHPAPTIAAIQGAALGGGFQLATVCDFRIAAMDAKIGIPSTRLGIVVNFENVQRLVLLAGVAMAKEILMAGRILSGEEAWSAGLVTGTHPKEDLDEGVSTLAGSIARLAPLSVRGAKRAIGAVTEHLSGARGSNADAVARVDRLVAEAYASADLQEGLAAIAEKRAPHFEGA